MFLVLTIIAQIYSLLPTYPASHFNIRDDHNASFISSAVIADPNNRYKSLFASPASLPDWFLVMRYKDKRVNMLADHSKHQNETYNTINNNRILLHIKTLGTFSTEIVFPVYYSVEQKGSQITLTLTKDNSYTRTHIDKFRAEVIIYPSSQKGLDIGVVRGYISVGGYSVDMCENQVKWVLDNILQNIAEKVK